MPDHVHGYVLVWSLHDRQWYQLDFVCLHVGTLLAGLVPATHVCHIVPQSEPVKPVPQAGSHLLLSQVTGEGSLVGDSEDGLYVTNGENMLAYHHNPGSVSPSLVEEVTLVVHVTVSSASLSSAGVQHQILPPGRCKCVFTHFLGLEESPVCNCRI